MRYSGGLLTELPPTRKPSSMRWTNVAAAFSCGIVVVFCLHGTRAQANPDMTRPNVIIMMADDMGLGDTSAYQFLTGNSDADQVKTPSMERLARLGVSFVDAHSPSSRCTATRAALLTGRYTWRTYLKWSVLWSPQGNPLIERERPTLATLLYASRNRRP